MKAPSIHIVAKNAVPACRCRLSVQVGGIVLKKGVPLGVPIRL